MWTLIKCPRYAFIYALSSYYDILYYNMKNYYEILNVTPDVDEKDIYESYRKKINQFNGLPFFTNKMISEIKNLKVAIYILGDPQKRIKYNKKMNKLKEYNEASKYLDNTKICDRLFSIKFS